MPPALLRGALFGGRRLLKRLAEKTGATEAEIIRQALDLHINGLKFRKQRPEAWQEERAFVRKWRKKGPVARRRTWPARTCMSVSFFVDTNILVHAYDRSELPRQERSLESLDVLASTGAGAVSTQVLAEFFVAVTSKPAEPLSVPDAVDRLCTISRSGRCSMLPAWSCWKRSGA